MGESVDQLKNLFAFAPKELSQDAFLRWVFENYRHPEMSGLARELILFLTKGFEQTPAIDISRHPFERLTTWSQVGHMDIGVDFFFEGHGKYSDYVLVIEDKVGSQEHNQLKAYNDTLQRWSNPYDHERIIKVYYKTQPMDDPAEYDRVKDAGWTIIPFEAIVDFWKRFVDHPNLIVRFYAKHICKIGESAAMESLPKENDVLAWRSFLGRKVVGPLKKTFPETRIAIGTNMHGYTYLNVSKANLCDSECPYLEIRSRDVFDGSFVARILLYGVVITPESLAKLRKCIGCPESVLFAANQSEKNNKQAGRTKKNDASLSSADEDSFLDSLMRCIREYLAIIDRWLAMG